MTSANINSITIDGKVVVKSKTINRDADAPSSKQFGQEMLVYRDKDGENIGYIQPVRTIDDMIGLQISPVNEKSDGTPSTGAFTVYADRQGNTYYDVNNPENFCSAIDALPARAEVKGDTGGDLNDMQRGECWWGSNFTNAPSTNWFMVSRQGNYQTAYGFNGNAGAPLVYVRSCVNDVWQPWMRSMNANGDSVEGTISRNTTGSVSYIGSWNDGASLIRLTKTEGSSIWRPIVALRTKGGGGWAIGNYDNETLEFVYGTKANINSNTNTTTQIYFTESGGANFPSTVVSNYGFISNYGTGGSYNEGIRLNRSSSGWATIAIGGAANSVSGTADYQWFIGSPPTSNGRRLIIGHNSSANNVNCFFTGGNNNAVGLQLTGQYQFKATNINRDATLPSSDQWASAYNIYDNDGEAIAQVRAVLRSANGRVDSMLMAYNEKSDGTQVENRIQVSIAKDGVQTYFVNNAANFRSAIGAAASSDRRLKSDILPLGEDAVEFINALEPSVYTINGERQVGLIAQDVYEADPWDTRMAFETREDIDGLDDWERMDDGSPTWKLDYIRIIPPLVAAVQSANRRIESLEAEIAELRALVAELIEG